MAWPQVIPLSNIHGTQSASECHHFGPDSPDFKKIDAMITLTKETTVNIRLTDVR
jgi:hypothetical protein